MITFTIDLEDHLGLYAANGRWVANTKRILAFCAERKISATFFTVGRVAEAAPQLLKTIVAEGHELALHSYDHIRLDQEDAKTYGAKCAAAKARMEDITGNALLGFRAPVFSLNQKSIWAIEILGDLGFTYSSSIIAGKGALGGFAGAPQTPFLWPNGLIEIPVPLLDFKVLAVPFLGGVYLRYLPLALVKLLQQAMPKAALLWTYTHPYDVDEEEGFVRFTDGTPMWANWLLVCHRKGFLEKLGKLLDGQAAPTLASRIANVEWKKTLPVWADQQEKISPQLSSMYDR